ncbi:hypothetical protein K439DRAFT_1614058 [Ramaria rubella]|nr:hypothetical protein K439DRAFT_1614058 [Ramaria rubella]
MVTQPWDQTATALTRAAAQATAKSSMDDIRSEMFVSLPAVLHNCTVHGLFPEELGTCPTTRSDAVNATVSIALLGKCVFLVVLGAGELLDSEMLPASFLGLDSTGLRNLPADIHRFLKVCTARDTNIEYESM